MKTKHANEVTALQSIVKLLPKIQAFIMQHFNKLAVICDLHQIRHLLNKLSNMVQLPMFNDMTIFDNAINNYNFHIANKHLTYMQQLFKKHVNNNQSLDLRLIKLVKQQEHVLHSYYKWLKESIESLQDLNIRITKNITKSISNKIQAFLIRGASPTEGKLAAGQLLSNIITDSKVNPKNVVEKFYRLFIENIFFIIEENSGNKQQIRELQDTIINKIPNISGVSLHQYFDELINYAIKHHYSHARLLLQYFCNNELVMHDVSSVCEQYKSSIIKCLAAIKKAQETNAWSKEYSEEYIKLLAKLMLLFPRDMFIDTIKVCLDEVKLFFRTMFITWGSIFLEVSASSNEIEQIKLKNIRNNLKELFLFFYKLAPEMLYEQMQKIVKDDAEVVKLIVINIFPNDIVVKFLGSLTNSVDIKYCFEQVFFSLLLQRLPKHVDFFNVNQLEFFLNLVFYIGNYDRSTTMLLKDVEQKLQQLQSCIHNYIDSKQQLAVLDILKATAEYGSWQLRINSTIGILTNINNNRYSNSNVEYMQAAMLNVFIDNEDNSVKSTFYQQLAKTGYIHLLKNIKENDRRSKIIDELKKCNKAFRVYCSYLQGSGANFDLSQLTPGFNVPFYLFFSEQLNLSKMDCSLITAVVFKIFIHAVDDYSKKAIEDYRIEFKEIINSVQRLLAFYTDNQQEFKGSDYNGYIHRKYENLKQHVINFIINGFSEENTDTLAERKRNARLIIDNAINYKASKQQACSVNSVIYTEIQKSNKDAVKIIKDFFVEISNVFKNALIRNGKTLAEWVGSTSSVGERIAFLCARRKYAESDFSTWFFKKNPGKIASAKLTEQLNVVRQDLDEPNHKAALIKVGINYLQYNQEYALALIYKYLAEVQQKNNNLFMQLGTGQGKSLVIAETARKILAENSQVNQVFIITCYSHLAIRDHKRFELFFNVGGKVNLRGSYLDVGTEGEPTITANFNDSIYKFYEIPVPEDGDCAFHALGLNKQHSIKQLLKYSEDAVIAKLIAQEFNCALREPNYLEFRNRLPIMFIEKFIYLDGNYNKKNALLNDYVNQINNKYNPNIRHSADYILNNLVAISDAINLTIEEQQQLRELGQARAFALEELLQFLGRQENLETFINTYINSNTSRGVVFWLGFDETGKNQGLMEALAIINKMNFKIWRAKKDIDGNLIEGEAEMMYQFAGNKDSDEYRDVLFKGNHFNALTLSPGTLRANGVTGQTVENRDATKSTGFSMSGIPLNGGNAEKSQGFDLGLQGQYSNLRDKKTQANKPSILGEWDVHTTSDLSGINRGANQTKSSCQEKRSGTFIPYSHGVFKDLVGQDRAEPEPVRVVVPDVELEMDREDASETLTPEERYAMEPEQPIRAAASSILCYKYIFSVI